MVLRSMKKRIWVDLLNPSHPLFFKALIDELEEDYDFQITVRQRAETIALSDQLGLNAKAMGAFYDGKKMKTIGTINRVITLFSQVEPFDWSLSFENSDCVAVSRMRLKKSILLFDNDLKFRKNTGYIQFLENRVKLFANHIIVPKAAENVFNGFSCRKNIHTVNGYKEDVYIADFQPNPSFKKIIPFDHYIIIRPEALGSFYVQGGKSLVPRLFTYFKDRDVNIVYLPREKNDMKLAKGYDVFIPKKPVYGLDICYYSDAVLTGSGTMAREAACMGKPAVSFFPNKNFLGVDEQLIGEGKMVHSRDPAEIGEYVLSQKKEEISTDFNRSKKVKNEVLTIIKDILN